MEIRKLKNYLKKFKAYFGICFTIFFFIAIIIHIFSNGIGALNFEFIFSLGKKEGDSLLPAIVNTLIIIFLTLIIAVPIGVSSAIYLNEYSKKASRLVKFIRLTTQSLSGIPSVIYGLFGFLFFVITLKWSWSILAGSLTLVIMVLPIIITSTEEALKSVPNSYKEGSYALGVGKLRTILLVILPSCISGIITSIILSAGRIVGETAALMLTAGTVMKIPKSIFSSGATLSVFMYSLTTEGLELEKAYGVGIILIVIVFLINRLSNYIGKKFRRD